jgi:glycosyltransferase involved in cell wall biosynthesis
MNIGVDAWGLLHGDWHGSTRYLRSLLRAMVKHDGGHTYHLIFRMFSRAARRYFRENFDPSGMPEGARVLRQYLPRAVIERYWDLFEAELPFNNYLWGSFDIYLTGNYSLVPVLRKTRIVYLIYDCIPLSVDCYTDWRGEWSGIIRKGIRRASALVTISESAKLDITTHFGVEPDRVHVVYPAVSERFHPIDRKEAATVLERRLNLSPPYLLYVGNMIRHKNVPLLVTAYAMARGNTGIPHKLVLVSWGGEDSEKVAKLIKQHGCDGSVVVLKCVDDEWLPYVYSGADAFITCSQYEGFGMPVVEAMACGTPVIALQTPPMEEVVAGCGLLVDTADVEGVTAAIIRATTDDGLRHVLAEKGLGRARRFSCWEDSARTLLGVFESL